MDAYASRKFMLAAAALLAAILSPALGWSTGPEAFTAMQWILALYFGANVAQKGLAPPALSAEVNSAIARQLEANTALAEQVTASSRQAQDLAQRAMAAINFSGAGKL